MRATSIRARTAIALVAAAALALAGCGTSGGSVGQQADHTMVVAKLTGISANITIAMTSNPGSLPQLTSDYIAAVQSSLDVLGPTEAKQKLSQTAIQVGPACGACAQSLNAAIAQIGS